MNDFGLGLGGGLRGGLRGEPSSGVRDRNDLANRPGMDATRYGFGKERGNFVHSVKQQLAPLMAQNLPLYRAIMGRLGDSFGATKDALFAKPNERPEQGPARQFSGVFPQEMILPQLNALQQQNPDLYQMIMQQLAGGLTPVRPANIGPKIDPKKPLALGGPAALAGNSFPNRAPARFPNPLGGT